MKFINSFALKIVLVGILALAMLIPLQMISGLVRERQNNADETVRAISDEWSRAQTLAGPRLVFEYEVTEKDAAGKTSITDKTGKLIAIKNVNDEEDLMIINRNGVLIRLKVNDLRVMGRATQGVRLINLKANDVIAAVTQVPTEEEEEENPEMENAEMEMIL